MESILSAYLRWCSCKMKILIVPNMMSKVAKYHGEHCKWQQNLHFSMASLSSLINSRLLEATASYPIPDTWDLALTSRPSELSSLTTCPLLIATLPAAPSHLRNEMETGFDEFHKVSLNTVHSLTYPCPSALPLNRPPPHQV